MTSLQRRQWRLTNVERSELRASLDSVGFKLPSPIVPRGNRALKRPETDEEMLKTRKQIALEVYVTIVDRNLELALRSFMPDELWDLLHAIEVAQNGLSRGRVAALRQGEAEYRRLADEVVGAWRDFRRMRERLLAMAAARGFRGWDDPDQPRYLNSAPLETEKWDALMTVERSLLLHATSRVIYWFDSRARLAGADRPQRLVALRREVASLLASSGLGYERIAALATAKYWRIPPCPALRQRPLADLLKADLRPSRRRPSAQESVPVEP